MQAANCKNRFIAMSSHANHMDTVEIKELISGVETYNTINDVQVHRVYFLHHLQKKQEGRPKTDLQYFETLSHAHHHIRM